MRTIAAALAVTLCAGHDACDHMSIRRNADPLPVSQAELSSVKVVEMAVVRENGQARVTGRLRNDSGKTLRQVVLQVRFLDETGEVVAEQRLAAVDAHEKAPTGLLQAGQSVTLSGKASALHADLIPSGWTGRVEVVVAHLAFAG